ncbi:hypothetical protein CEXT_243951 [Caerostris extrusa]|uniref:Uncharacterized protein n=1 Tax=Caerostris extrusa TaxID=172846 RepID=A0AAV4RSR8_CAEEX|nr:hypothetical protein CEXT_243951 [Caerostris extrusa]
MKPPVNGAGAYIVSQKEGLFEDGTAEGERCCCSSAEELDFFLFNTKMFLRSRGSTQLNNTGSEQQQKQQSTRQLNVRGRVAVTSRHDFCNTVVRFRNRELYYANDCITTERRGRGGKNNFCIPFPPPLRVVTFSKENEECDKVFTSLEV